MTDPNYNLFEGMKRVFDPRKFAKLFTGPVANRFLNTVDKHGQYYAIEGLSKETPLDEEKLRMLEHLDPDWEEYAKKNRDLVKSKSPFGTVPRLVEMDKFSRSPKNLAALHAKEIKRHGITEEEFRAHKILKQQEKMQTLKEANKIAPTSDYDQKMQKLQAKIEQEEKALGSELNNVLEKAKTTYTPIARRTRARTEERELESDKLANRMSAYTSQGALAMGLDMMTGGVLGTALMAGKTAFDATSAYYAPGANEASKKIEHIEDDDENDEFELPVDEVEPAVATQDETQPTITQEATRVKDYGPIFNAMSRSMKKQERNKYSKRKREEFSPATFAAIKEMTAANAMFDPANYMTSGLMPPAYLPQGLSGVSNFDLMRSDAVNFYKYDVSPFAI